MAKAQRQVNTHTNREKVSRVVDRALRVINTYHLVENLVAVSQAATGSRWIADLYDILTQVSKGFATCPAKQGRLATLQTSTSARKCTG